MRRGPKVDLRGEEFARPFAFGRRPDSRQPAKSLVSDTGRIITVTTTTQPLDNCSEATDQLHARIRLALVWLTIGALFVWVFFENLGKGLYKPVYYAGLIQQYMALPLGRGRL
jgi:hypothetical protein